MDDYLQKELNTLIQKSEERFRTIFQQNKSVMLLIDPESGHILDANKAATDFYGYPDLHSMNIHSINQFSEVEVNSLMDEAINTNKNHFFFRHKTANGIMRDVEVFSTPVVCKKQKILFSIVHDITERKEAERYSTVLASATMELIQKQTPGQVYKYTADKLNEMLQGQSIITIVEYDNPNNTWHMMEVRGINPFIEKTLRTFGIDINRMKGEIKTGFLSDVQKGKLLPLDFNLHELTNGKIPQKTSNALKKMLPIKKLLVMPFKKDADIFGTVTIAMLKSNIHHFYPSLIESFISQVAVFLEKLFIEQELKTSENYYRALIENSTDIVSILDKNGRIIYGSPSYKNLLGYDPENMEGKNVFAFMHPEDKLDTQNQLTQLLKEPGSIKKVSFKYLHKNGTWRRMEATAKNLLQNSSINGIVINSRDITDRTEAENALFQHEKSLKLRNKIANAFILADENEQFQQILNIFLTHFQSEFGYFGYINEAGYLVCPTFTHSVWDRCFMENKAMEFPPESWGGLFGKSLESKKTLIKNEGLHFPRGHIKLQNALAATIVHNNKRIGQIVLGNKSGGYTDEDRHSVIELSNYISPLLKSVLNENKYKNDLLKAKEKAEESERLKSAFLANMSHEIRTPMNGILGFLNILQEPEISDDEKENYLSLVQSSSNRMLNTINNIIEISKIEAKQTPIYFSEVALSEIMTEHLRFFSPEAEKKGLAFHLPDQCLKDDRVIRTDKTKLDFIISNLINNALKFTKEGEIEFGYGEKGQLLEFYVKDTGMGIPPAKIVRIFKPFEQADIGINRGYEGSGLGLSISKAYVTILGGEIWVESKKGKGTTFFFTIKMNPPHQQLSSNY